MPTVITNETWQQTLREVLKTCPIHPEMTYGAGPKDDFSDAGHLCPADVFWNDTKILRKATGSPTHTACMGTALWAVLETMKKLGLEKHISLADLKEFFALTATDEGNKWATKTPYYENPMSGGIAHAFVEMGWSDQEVYRDETEVKFGDVGILWHADESNNNQLVSGHTFLVVNHEVGPIERYPKIASDRAYVDTWSAQPNGYNQDENGNWVKSPGPGYDYWYVGRVRTHKSWPGQKFKRTFFFATPSFEFED